MPDTAIMFFPKTSMLTFSLTSTQCEHAKQGTKTRKQSTHKNALLTEKRELLSFAVVDANTLIYSFHKHGWLYVALKLLGILFLLWTSSPSSFLYSLCPPPPNHSQRATLCKEKWGWGQRVSLSCTKANPQPPSSPKEKRTTPVTMAPQVLSPIRSTDAIHWFWTDSHVED